MKALVCGGGIAGLTLAYWLDRHGITPVVVERSALGRGDGYGIDFHGTGHDIAARMGIVDELAERQLPIEAVDFIDAGGRTTARLGRDLLEKIIRGPHLALMHSSLEHALAEAVAPVADIRYERSITAVHQTESRVEVVFTDGAEEEFDVLIGADGVHSTTRALVFGEEKHFARHLGHHLACHPVPDEYGLGRRRVHYTEPERQVVVYPTDTAGESIALYLFRSDDPRPVPRPRRRELLRERYDGMGWITPRLLAHTPEEPFMDTMTQIEMPEWHRGRVALVGDACGAMTLVSAQGVSMAMAGAYTLAEALRNATDVPAAFAGYERRMRPEVRRRQRNARTFAGSLVPATRLGVSVQERVAGLLMRDAFAGLLRRRFGVESILASLDHTRSEDMR